MSSIEITKSYSCPKCKGAPYQSAVCTKKNPIFDCEVAKLISHFHHYCADRGCLNVWIQVMSND